MKRIVISLVFFTLFCEPLHADQAKEYDDWKKDFLPIQPSPPPRPAGLNPDWVYLATASSGDPILYYNKRTIVRMQAVVKVWLMYNYVQPSLERGHRSAKQLTQFRCAERTAATVKFVNYTGEYGDGAPVLSHDIEPVTFRDVIPDSLNEIALETVCTPLKASSSAPLKK